MYKLYTSKTCVYCPQIKKLLDHKGIAYDVIDITDDISLLKEASDISGMYTVPQLQRGDQVIVGYDLPKLMNFIQNA